MVDYGDMRERMARIESGQDAIRAMLVEALEDIRPRVTKIERRQWMQLGGGGVIAFLLGKFGIPFPNH